MCCFAPPTITSSFSATSHWSSPLSKKCVVILGGARSGKSNFAQDLAKKLSNKVLFVATGQALDDEMQARIEQHQKDRPKSWRTLETPTNLGTQIEKHVGNAQVVLIDCLTLLVSNLLGDDSDYPRAESKVIAEINGLIACTCKVNASFIIISNEVGLGIVPENRTARLYRDLLGKANQLLAQYANEVYFLVAGIATQIK
ncbi:MAG: bifunctional adenosylcobinamide kinase/adenosylcobinamide-phosphate guanylyltransferase [Chloroflexi bacterium]|nr:bifunctional adenosylcobinamide kinase/adenosylcobinamide-phosphate guanylyltransferase [Chloroflexota bacterium]